MAMQNKTLLRFLLVGLGSNFINFAIYLMLESWGSLFLASMAGYISGLFVSYHFGRIWVFGRKFLITQKNIFSFLIVYAIGGLGMSGLIEVFSVTTSIDYRINWLIGASFAVLNNFFGLKWFVFKGNK